MRLIEIQNAELYIRKSPDPVGIALKKNGAAVDFRSRERLSDRTMRIDSESRQTRSHRKHGGTNEIHLFGIPRARKIRRDDRGPTKRSARRMLCAQRPSACQRASCCRSSSSASGDRRDPVLAKR